MPYDSIETALEAIRSGAFVVVMDDASRENTGFLVIGAEKITTKTMAFLLRHTRGIIYTALTDERLDALQLPKTSGIHGEARHAASAVSVDFNTAVDLGLSAADRSATVRALADPTIGPERFTRPGHVFPVRARRHGVLEHPGQAEAAVDLARLAGLYPAAALSTIAADDGSPVCGSALLAFAQEHWLPIVSVADLLAYRRRTERSIEHIAEARLPTSAGSFTAHVYRSLLDGSEHLALVKGQVRGEDNVLVRIHSECLTGDVFGSLRCDCGNQLKMALTQIERAGSGVLVYLRGHEGRGIGLAHKLRAYGLQDQGRDTVEANLDLGLPVDSRRYDVGAQILADLGVNTLRLMSNNPVKFAQLEDYGLKIVGRVPLEAAPNRENLVYLRTKSEKLGHWLNLDGWPLNAHNGANVPLSAE
ncbi:GTP cyclohydrolase II [Methylocaldum szegediense]|jgi:3,4-dihydroxy 2-butanone 4-phosphate synthase/GTP cyclohydrolase II|uniref:GTP cyclohydrolase-2 n=1 Tax=Methylocaldum szegediense TaxID=73780 RepID=A0ABM9I9J4_9GAMM|nr:GTP cyclohydrolase II [Methylocaldum szegediense]CAI8975188.1 3,4-dihydroxy-2-butanone 4-phosphate synthase / GTP cyclohydrolase-2 [Methylocaldum szegediense]